MIKTVMLVVLDGFGINPSEEANAIKLANMPFLNKLLEDSPNNIIYTSGEQVGLPEGQMGNSEVGHTNIGAGRVVYQDLLRINKDIESGNVFINTALVEAIENVQEKGTNLHIMGLVSDGGVHSHIRHLKAILELAKRKGLEEDRVFVHAFLDGRDTSPTSGLKFIQELEETIEEKQIGSIATISGRYYAMDRDNRWDRVEKAYRTIFYGEGIKNSNPMAAVEESYRQEVYDEFIIPTVITDNDNPKGMIEEDDSVIFFNFRPDRARELTRAIVDPFFNEFETKNIKTHFVTMTEYDKNIENVEIAYKTENINNGFGEYISSKGMKQLRIAETEKYAHVTFFFNGGREEEYEGEDRILIQSPQVPTYDLKPEMSAIEVTDRVVEAIKSNKYDSIILNFANPDMVGHTGNLNATISALETIDDCIERITNAIKEVEGVLLITSDHGNAEQMINYETGEPFTAHTTNPVPIILVNYDSQIDSGTLADLAPTMLEIMGLEKPVEMTGKSLIKR